MAILTVSTVPMRIQRCITVPLLSHVQTINSRVKMAVASTRAGHVITITIAAMARTKENSAIHNTRHARRKSSRVRTSNASERSIDAMAKTIVAITRTRLTARKTTIHALLVSLHATMDNALTRIWCATKYLTAATTRTSRFIVMSTSALKLKSTNAATNALTRRRAITAIAIKDISCWPMARLALTLTSAWRHREFVRNIVRTRQAAITANATRSFTSDRPMSIRASGKIYANNRGCFSPINIMCETFLSTVRPTTLSIKI